MPKPFAALSMVACFIFAACVVPAARAVDQGPVIDDRVKKLTRAVKWNLVTAIPINFNTYHPQGMAKIGDEYFLSTRLNGGLVSTMLPMPSRRSNRMVFMARVLCGGRLW